MWPVTMPEWVGDITLSNENGVQVRYDSTRKIWVFNGQVIADGAAANLVVQDFYNLAWGKNSQMSNHWGAANVSYGSESLKLVDGVGGLVTGIQDAGGGKITLLTPSTGTAAGGDVLALRTNDQHLGLYYVDSVVVDTSITVNGAFYGDQAGVWVLPFKTGAYNLAIGTQAGDGIIGGVRNALFGSKAGYALVHGQGNLFLGAFSGASFGDSNNQIALSNDAGDQIRLKDSRTLQLLAGIYADVPYVLKQTGVPVTMMGVDTAFVGPYTISDESGSVGITSTGQHGMTSAVAVGNSIYVQGGTNWNAGFYTITALDADTTGVKITINLAYDAGLGGDVAIALAGTGVTAFSATIPGGKLGLNGSLEHRYMFFSDNHSGGWCGYAIYLDSHVWVANSAPVQFSAAGVVGFANAGDEGVQWGNTMGGTTGFALSGGDYRSLATIDTTSDKVWSVQFIAGGANDTVSFINNRTMIYPG